MNKVGFFRSIQLKFIIIYILLLLVAVQVIGSYLAQALEVNLMNTFKESVNDRIDLLSYNLEQVFNKERSEDGKEPKLGEDVQAIISNIDTATITSLQVIDNQNRVIGAIGYSNQDIVGKKTTVDIVQKALLFGTSLDNTALDDRTKNRIFVKATPIKDRKDNVVGVIYTEASLEGVHGQLQEINQVIFQGSVLMITVSAILGVFVARAITKPIIEMRHQAQTMARGDFTQKVNVYGTDEISQLAEAFNDLNDRLKHSTASVEKEQRKLSSVLSNMSEGVIATDKDGQITLMNDAAGRLLGRNPNKLIGEFLLDFLDFEDRIVDITELQTSSSMIIDMSEEDDIFLMRATFSTIYDEGHQISGFIIVINDVTEDEKMEQERREFVSNVSHELRTPLTTMRSYLEALSEGAWQDEEIAPKFLEVTQKETERMIRLVNDLLQLSRMDNKEFSLQRKRTDFIAYFHQIIDRFEMHKADGLLLERNLPEDKLYVWMDEDKMTQILDNILSNAIKYSPEGGTISCKVEKLDGKNREIIISIKDQGLGIPFDRREKIFERFYRSDRARTRKLGGSGLGLAITKELVEAHYGRIWADSIEGKGTIINFTLPIMNRKRGRSR
jgi:two-component system sensor histidine kinase VicK